jgi:5-formyltetrahydrofolate cyclo-ligase
MDKAALRNEILSFRKALPADDKSVNDNLIFEKITGLKEYLEADLVLTYVSGPYEVDTRRFICDALERGKKVAVPKCNPESNEMTFFVINSFDDLETGYFNISEPKSSCCEAKIKSNCFCVVPALAVDKNRNRLGYGKGFYDRFLSENNLFSVCLCYSENKYDLIPTDVFDKAVDLVVTDQFSC